VLTTTLRRDTRHERALRALGGVLALIGVGAMFGALMIGPWQGYSLDDVLAIFRCMVLGFTGFVVKIVGWVLRDSGRRVRSAIRRSSPSFARFAPCAPGLARREVTAKYLHAIEAAPASTYVTHAASFKVLLRSPWKARTGQRRRT